MPTFLENQFKCMHFAVNNFTNNTVESSLDTLMEIHTALSRGEIIRPDVNLTKILDFSKNEIDYCKKLWDKIDASYQLSLLPPENFSAVFKNMLQQLFIIFILPIKNSFTLAKYAQWLEYKIEKKIFELELSLEKILVG